jgi:AraC family transcriptional regulator of arabinose operon
VRWWQGGSPHRTALALNAIERCVLLLSLDRPGEAWADLHPGVRRALAYLAPGPAEKVTVAALARRAGMSPSHLAHIFRAQTGTTPLAWLEDRRLARARQLLLTTDLAVKSIAALCGFADGEHLARRFRSRTGRSPGDWRAHPDAG